MSKHIETADTLYQLHRDISAALTKAKLKLPQEVKKQIRPTHGQPYESVPMLDDFEKALNELDNNISNYLTKEQTA